LTIFTAASLTDAFREMGANIEQANPGTKVTFNFAGSPTLRTQLAQGARADVFASADEPNMQGAQKDGTIASEPRLFVRNQLVAIVPAANPAQVMRLQDLAKPGVKLVLTNKEVPVGNYSRQALAKMSQDTAFGAEFATRVLANLVSEETNVKQVVAKVQLGEADAGILSIQVTSRQRCVVPCRCWRFQTPSTSSPTIPLRSSMRHRMRQGRTPSSTTCSLRLGRQS
jgi:molybdate transport system substrate-binding protein